MINLTGLTGIGTASTVVGGWLADRYGKIRVVQAGYVIAVVGLAGLVAAPAYLPIVATGLGLYLPFSAHTTLGQDFPRHRLATASGLATGLATSTSGLLASALGAFADAQGQRAALTRLREPQRSLPLMA